MFLDENQWLQPFTNSHVENPTLPGPPASVQANYDDDDGDGDDDDDEDEAGMVTCSMDVRNSISYESPKKKP